MVATAHVCELKLQGTSNPAVRGQSSRDSPAEQSRPGQDSGSAQEQVAASTGGGGVGGAGSFVARGRSETSAVHQGIVRPSARLKPCPYAVHSFFKGKLGVTHYRWEDGGGSNKGPVVVAFHGLNGTRSTFQAAAKDLVALGYRVLTFDLFGHGLSSCPRYDVFRGFNYTAPFFVGQVEELLEHLGLGTAELNLMGFSLGCIIAATFAEKYADRIARTIFVSPAGMLVAKPRSVYGVKALSCCVPCAGVCVCRCCFRKEAFLSRCSESDRQSGAAELLWGRILWSIFDKKGTVPAFLGCVSRVPLWSSEPTYRRLGSHGIPTLVLWGTNDNVVDISVAPKFVSCFANVAMVKFEGCTHLLLSERSNETTALAATFLSLPTRCQMQDAKYLLPFSEDGAYKSPSQRKPPNITQKQYFEIIGYRPEFWFNVRTPKTHKATTPSRDEDGENFLRRHQHKLQNASSSEHGEHGEQGEQRELQPLPPDAVLAQSFSSLFGLDDGSMEQLRRNSNKN